MAKVRFTAQRDEYNCGPTSLINLFKWQGYSISWKDIPSIRRELWGSHQREKAMRGCGTPTYLMDMFILTDDQTKSTLVTRLNKPTIGQLKKYLKRGKAVIIDFYWPKKDGGHYALIIGHRGDRFITVNLKLGKTVQQIRNSAMKSLLSTEIEELGISKFSCAWVFSKE